VRQSLLPSRRAGKGRKALLPRPAAVAERIERAHSLDPVVRSLSDSVVRALPAGPRTDALHGVPFGQPAHPALVRLPLGCWISAVLLDLFGGTERASASGLALASVGTYFGGHLALRLGAGTSHADQVSHLSGLGWHDLCDLAGLPDRRPVRRQLGYLSLLVYRQGGEVSVLSDRCSHLGGPLHQGRILVERGAACVACPWHGSTFVIADGTVMHGPATARQPSFETRVTADGRVELRPRP